MGGRDQRLEDILDALETAGDDGDVTVGDVLERFEDRSLGAIICVLGLIAVIPVIGAIPGVSMLVATLILIVVVQSVVRTEGGLWAPRVVRRRGIGREVLQAGLERARPYVRRIDRWLKPRLRVLAAGRLQRLMLVAAVAFLAVTFYPLAFVPWGVTAPALGIVAIGLALISRDGALALTGYVLAGITIGVMLWLL